VHFLLSVPFRGGCPPRIPPTTVAGAQNNRTLASFFSPGKSKQWKQVATLDGHPYVVGHVPRGLNSREEEFEGLLRGNNSSTKMISLGRDGPVKRDVTYSEGALFGSSLSAASKHSRPDPLFAGPQEESTVHPSTRLVQAGTPQWRFRLPAGLPLTPNSRASGLTPSEAENIDFETRLASYSDDELNSLNTNSRKMTKEEHRRSKDDARVDILVASHSRRAGTQDAELRRPGGPRPRNASRPDPEAARPEVAQVLAGIRAPSSQFDGDGVDIEPMNVPHSSKIDGSGSHLDEIYAPMIPSILDSAEPEEVQEGDPQHAQRRMGYFDIHSERRPMHLTGDEDILDQFAQAASDMEPLPRWSDTTTDSVYSSGPTPPLRRHVLSRNPRWNAFKSTRLPRPFPSLPSCRLR
jgi:hypothetical protein